jgi:hypothetical protein
VTYEANRYACAAERRFLFMIATNDSETAIWGQVVDLLFAEEFEKAVWLCQEHDFESESEKISDFVLTSV